MEALNNRMSLLRSANDLADLLLIVVDYYDGDMAKAYYEVMNNGAFNVFDGEYIDELRPDIINLQSDGEKIKLLFGGSAMLPSVNKSGYEL